MLALPVDGNCPILIKGIEIIQVTCPCSAEPAEAIEKPIVESVGTMETPILEFVKTLLERKDETRLQRINDTISIKLSMKEMSKGVWQIESERRKEVLQNKKELVELDLHRHGFKLSSDVRNTLGPSFMPKDKLLIVPESEEAILVAEEKYIVDFFKCNRFEDFRTREKVMRASQDLLKSHRLQLDRKCFADCECSECNMKTGRMHTTFSMIQAVAFAVGDKIKLFPELHQVFKFMAGLEPASRDQMLSCLGTLGDKCLQLGIDFTAHLSTPKTQTSARFIKECLLAEEIKIEDIRETWVWDKTITKRPVSDSSMLNISGMSFKDYRAIMAPAENGGAIFLCEASNYPGVGPWERSTRIAPLPKDIYYKEKQYRLMGIRSRVKISDMHRLTKGMPAISQWTELADHTVFAQRVFVGNKEKWVTISRDKAFISDLKAYNMRADIMIYMPVLTDDGSTIDKRESDAGKESKTD